MSKPAGEWTMERITYQAGSLALQASAVKASLIWSFLSPRRSLMNLSILPATIITIILASQVSCTQSNAQ
jgi:hypothetical protein